MLKVLDIFAGAGGFSLGFKLAGNIIIGAIEEDKWAAETFAYNHKEAKVLIGDIQNFSDEYLLDEFKDNLPDVILGSPPCQGYSICRKNAGDPKDPRNSLFQEFLRIGKLFQPDLLIMENVPGLIKAKTILGESVINIIKSELEQIGYYVYIDILEAFKYGIPQIRRRLFVIASRDKLERPFPAPTHYFQDGEQLQIFDSHLKPCASLWDAISDLPDINAREGQEEMKYDREATNEYQYQMRIGSQKVYNHVAMKHSKRTIERFELMSWGESLADIPEHLKPYKRNSNGIISETVYDQNSRRLHPYKLCHTIPASFYANFVHPYKNRNFTAREGARIQSFPDWFVFKGKPTVVSHKLLQREGRVEEKHLCQYNQIGNAVPPLLAKSIAENIINETKKIC
ncbi:type II DNA modification methyltransferase [Tolypothrix tenuis PCC 7101]|uniref:Cytosine-specific methyltransferase n=1 Tax=Tolypothrix tenuis PCC 7101 TaxID=231146 RepID=A0A1Z4N3C9_9CYAN|nr:DNA cytosine methyltransferase [Aulosira sp. FACHB-113]BAZ00206.1 type II DNA modification methyltransferase [Tolypothrix tenuis PCC 7101]BAZ75873.1 type II DNA modification methyltransferase [Aulosira laxa NIES-50]